jgi:hypothetical protein
VDENAARNEAVYLNAFVDLFFRSTAPMTIDPANARSSNYRW